MTRWHCCMRLNVHRVIHSTEGCTEKYEIHAVFLLPNSELTMGSLIISAMLMHVRFVLRWKTMAGGLFKLPITSLIVARNIKFGYSFSLLEWAEHFETKLEQIRLDFRFCNKSASHSAYKAQWLSGKLLECYRFEPQRRHCVVAFILS